ncbi:hypothetical protein [Chromohalobacter sp. 48-RD10]|uniref:hypothetical protein n=1 Tax=Chromohalobacter sp. 48-RD10 TaxID=2994063 RepID=UPI002469227A|nr:hypothetical protein [Chromohalobacter sp. 48-RD10]
MIVENGQVKISCLGKTLPKEAFCIEGRSAMSEQDIVVMQEFLQILNQNLLPFISILMTVFATLFIYLNYKINKRRFRLDVHNKKLGIYTSSVDYYLSFMYDQEVDNEVNKSFVKAYRESRFLFGQDSDVYQHLTELKNSISENPNTRKMDPEEALSSLEEILHNSHRYIGV